LHFGDRQTDRQTDYRQTDRQTDKQMDSSDALSRSGYREQRPNNNHTTVLQILTDLIRICCYRTVVKK